MQVLLCEVPTAQCARARPAALCTVQTGKPLHLRTFSVLGCLKVITRSLLQTVYCSSACQRADWRAGHRDTCSLDDAASAAVSCGFLQLLYCQTCAGCTCQPCQGLHRCVSAGCGRLLQPPPALKCTQRVHTAALPEPSSRAFMVSPSVAA